MSGSRILPFAKISKLDSCCKGNFRAGAAGILGMSLTLGRGLSFVAGKLSMGLGNTCGSRCTGAGGTDSSGTCCAPITGTSKSVSLHGCKASSRLDCKRPSGNFSGTHG